MPFALFISAFKIVLTYGIKKGYHFSINAKEIAEKQQPWVQLFKWVWPLAVLPFFVPILLDCLTSLFTHTKISLCNEAILVEAIIFPIVFIREYKPPEDAILWTGIMIGIASVSYVFDRMQRVATGEIWIWSYIVSSTVLITTFCWASFIKYHRLKTGH